MWKAHREQVDGARGVALLEEACRIADRLDRLDALLRGKAEAWATVVYDLPSGTFVLRIDSLLIEARQQANVLRQILASLPMKEAASDDDGDGWLDDL